MRGDSAYCARRPLRHHPPTHRPFIPHAPTAASEFFLIAVYACACVLLYSDADSTGRSGQVPFLTFEKAFISLYSLSLTVNDPDVYLPYYRMWFGNVFVFLSFLVLTFFMIHNIILARIFQIYATKLKETALRRCGIE